MTTNLEDARAIALSVKDAATQVGITLNEHVPSQGHPALTPEEIHATLGHLTAGVHNTALAIEKLLDSLSTPAPRRLLSHRK